MLLKNEKKKKMLTCKNIPNENKTLNLYLMLSKIWLETDHGYKYVK